MDSNETVLFAAVDSANKRVLCVRKVVAETDDDKEFLQHLSKFRKGASLRVTLSCIEDSELEDRKTLAALLQMQKAYWFTIKYKRDKKVVMVIQLRGKLEWLEVISDEGERDKVYKVTIGGTLEELIGSTKQ